MSTLEDIEARAQRVLDGMSVNREKLAEDTLKLCAAARRLQAEVVRLSPKPAKAHTTRDIFGDIFGGER